MIKAKDLRIGNFILYNGRQLEVTDIENSTPTERCYLNQDAIILDECQGIRITEEILLKFGFKMQPCNLFKTFTLDVRNHYGQYMEIILADADIEKLYPGDIINGSCVLKKHSEVERTPFYLPTCKYVHKLQNLYFALTFGTLEGI